MKVAIIAEKEGFLFAKSNVDADLIMIFKF